jgi:hypothetical protein
VVGGVVLRARDEVEFVLHVNLKTGEPNAARVRRMREAPDLPPKPGEPAAAQQLAWVCAAAQCEGDPLLAPPPLQCHRRLPSPCPTATPTSRG